MTYAYENVHRGAKGSTEHQVKGLYVYISDGNISLKYRVSDIQLERNKADIGCHEKQFNSFENHRFGMSSPTCLQFYSCHRCHTYWLGCVKSSSSCYKPS